MCNFVKNILERIDKRIEVHTRRKRLGGLYIVLVLHIAENTSRLSPVFCVWNLRELRYIQLFTGAPDGC